MGNNNLIGVRQLQSAFDRIGRAPAKVLTKATKTAANMVKNKAKQDAKSKEKGYATGQMIRGIKIKAEKRKVGKKVYRIAFFGKDGKGSEFVKISKAGKRSFYPVSQEYGWKDKNGKYHPGKRFLRGSYERDRLNIKQTMINVMVQEIRSLGG